MAFDNLRLDKGLYCAGKGFTQALEEIDPGEQYRGTALEGLDAYERQLKRFGIRIAGPSCDRVEKFFQNTDTAVLFPEYVKRSALRGLEDANKLGSIVAATTMIEGLDYRSLSCVNVTGNTVPEGGMMAEAEVKTKSNLVAMRKHGRLLCTSYEALRYHRLDLLSVLLRRIGADIAGELFGDAVQVLIFGDGSTGSEAPEIFKNDTDLAYEDLVALWNAFDPFNMTTILASAEMAQDVLALPELRDGSAGLDFHGSGNLVTPLGAELIKSAHVPPTALVALDKNCALEMVKAGEINTDYDRLIDCQFHRAAISATVGFAKVFPEAAVVLS